MKQASRPREAVVEGLEKCIGAMLMAIAEFKVPVPSATNCGPADMASRRRGKGHTLYDTFQSLTDVYREQNLALSRNARLDEAVKAFTSEVVDVLGIDFFRAPFGRYAHSVGLVRAEESRHFGSTPLSGLPSPPRDVGGLNEREDARDFLTSRTLPKPHASNLPSRNRAEGSSINHTSHVPSSQRAASGAGAASGYRPPSPVTGSKRPALTEPEVRPTAKRQVDYWTTTPAQPFQPPTALPATLPKVTAAPKTISYHDVAYETDVARRQDISTSKGQFYVFRCNLHGETKYFKAAHDARMHLSRSRLHSIQNADLNDAIRYLGIEVIGCDNTKMQSCNMVSLQMRRHERQVKVSQKTLDQRAPIATHDGITSESLRAGGLSSLTTAELLPAAPTPLSDTACLERNTGKDSVEKGDRILHSTTQQGTVTPDDGSPVVAATFEHGRGLATSLTSSPEGASEALKSHGPEMCVISDANPAMENEKPSLNALSLDIPSNTPHQDSTKAPTPRQPFAPMEQSLPIALGDDRNDANSLTEEANDKSVETESAIVRTAKSSNGKLFRVKSSSFTPETARVKSSAPLDATEDCIEVATSPPYDSLSEGEIRETSAEAQVAPPKSDADQARVLPAGSSTPKKQQRRRLKNSRDKNYSARSVSQLEDEPQTVFCADDAWRTKESPRRRNDARPGDEFLPRGCAHCPRRFNFMSQLKSHILDCHSQKN